MWTFQLDAGRARHAPEPMILSMSTPRSYQDEELLHSFTCDDCGLPHCGLCVRPHETGTKGGVVCAVCERKRGAEGPDMPEKKGARERKERAAAGARAAAAMRELSSESLM